MVFLRDYISIARFDHWIKHVFVLPGVVLSIVLLGVEWAIQDVVVGVISAGLTASANYVINEWLDAEFDKYHPMKKYRPAASGRINGFGVYFEYSLLLFVGLSLAWSVNYLFFAVMFIFALSGLAYNVKPLRFKDRAWADIIVESFNNPVRLVLGWSMVSTDTLPPTSLIISYWSSAAFLMTAKRLSEYRFLMKNSEDTIGMYRRSFQYYTESRLAIGSLVAAIIASVFLGVFLSKYRAELLLLIPAIAFLFSQYFQMAIDDRSIVQTPERLHKNKGLMITVAIVLFLSVTLSLVDISAMQIVVQSNIMKIGELPLSFIFGN